MKDTVVLQAPSIKNQTWAALRSIPWLIYTAVLASLAIIIGLIWDISWHMSIGRDAFLSPPHISIYLGGILAGIGGGYQIIKTTFFASAIERTASVWFWGFRSPLSALFHVWGALAMLTSAPFDDWWHNAYGLDVKILSPPHAVLALGIVVILLGSMICLLNYQNRLEKYELHQKEISDLTIPFVRAMYIFTVGMLIASVFIAFTEYFRKNMAHASICYIVACAVFPKYLVSSNRASAMKWPATTAAAIYMLTFMLMIWILPLFPATPKLGPVLNNVTHFVPFLFPKLLIFPAIAIDLLMRKHKGNDWWLAAKLSVGFLGIFLLAEWYFGYFMLSEYARNWFFHAHAWSYSSRPDYLYRYAFQPWDSSNWAFMKGILWALLICFFTCRIGLYWGNWMKKVVR